MTFGTFLFWSLLAGCLSWAISAIMHSRLSAKAFNIWFRSSAVVVLVVSLLILWCLINDGVLVKVSASEQVKDVEAIETEILVEEITAACFARMSGLPRSNIRVISKEGEIIFERKNGKTISKQDDRISTTTDGNASFGVADPAPITLHVADDGLARIGPVGEQTELHIVGHITSTPLELKHKGKDAPPLIEIVWTDGDSWSIYMRELDAMKEGIRILLKDHLERSKPTRYRSHSIFDDYPGPVMAEIPMVYNLLGDDGEWRRVSEEEFDAFLDSERLKAQAQIAAMKQLLQELKGRN